IETLQAGHRVDPDPRKHNVLDFILWKPAKPGEPSWDSPWGPGRPGWHIECSAMNHSIHGDQIDIHGGGIDLTFPHHENEIAQSEALTGKQFAKYWMHNNFINFGDEKMSKSLGNVVKARDFMEQYHPEVLKFMMLNVHYRSPLNLGKEQIHQAIAGLDRIYSAIRNADAILEGQPQCQEDKSFSDQLKQADKTIENALNDDFNTSVLMATIFDVVRVFNADIKPGKKVTPLYAGKAEQFKNWLKKYADITAMFQESASEFCDVLNQILIKEHNINVEEVNSLIAQRNAARANKDFQAADQIRDQLAGMGILVNDLVGETRWEVKKT
ncbi:MAG: class I tRNA ligase family protein, partial [Candidatus Omnitrophica bacterium]|nr:class I tRNA ligase family protein [Candidatus Omnitrophota bacterium]